MKSSKMENFFEIDPAIEESKSLSPLTYYQPFKSSFDPSFGKSTSRTSSMEPFTSRIQGNMWAGQSIRHKFSGININVGNKKGSFTTVQNSGTQFQAPKIFKNSVAGNVSSKHNDNIFSQIYPSCSRQWNINSTCPDGRICTRESQNFHQYSTVLSNIQTDTDLKKKSLENIQGNLNFRNSSELKSLMVSSNHPNYDTGGTAKNPICNNPSVVNSPRSCESGLNRLTICNFCKNNKEVPDIYLNHNLYDPKTKKLACPVLRKHVCGICGETGDRAHTLQYCPVNRQRGLQAKIPVLLKTRTITNSTGKIRRN